MISSPEFGKPARKSSIFRKVEDPISLTRHINKLICAHPTNISTANAKPIRKTSILDLFKNQGWSEIEACCDEPACEGLKLICKEDELLCLNCGKQKLNILNTKSQVALKPHFLQYQLMGHYIEQGWIKTKESCDDCDIFLLRTADYKTKICILCKKNYVPSPKVIPRANQINDILNQVRDGSFLSPNKNGENEPKLSTKYIEDDGRFQKSNRNIKSTVKSELSDILCQVRDGSFLSPIKKSDIINDASFSSPIKKNEIINRNQSGSFKKENEPKLFKIIKTLDDDQFIKTNISIKSAVKNETVVNRFTEEDSSAIQSKSNSYVPHNHLRPLSPLNLKETSFLPVIHEEVVSDEIDSDVMPNINDRLVEYSLNGWIMTEDSCEACRIPLMRKRGNTVSSCISCDDVEVQKSPSTAAEQLNSFKNNAVETNIHCEKLPKSKIITVTNILDQIKEKNHETQPKRKLSVSSSLPRSQDAVILSVMDSVKSLQLIHFSTSPILETLPSVIRAISTGMTTYKTMTKMNTIDDEFITEISEAMNVQLESLKLLLVNCTEPLKMQLIFECMKEISSFFSN